MNPDLITYYRERAREYDKVYQIPEEQEDLLNAADFYQQTNSEIINLHKALSFGCKL